MRWDSLGIIALLLMVYSQIEMASCAFFKQKQNHKSFFCFYNSYSITDYIEISMEEKGRIGGWFWVFLFSIILLVIIFINVMVLGSDLGPCLNTNQDDVWPIL